jgi:perosamine synthetase
VILVNEPLLDGNEKKYLQSCIEDNWISSDGPFVKQFEEMFACYIGVKYGVAVSNGTVALELALAALDIKKGDEVIMPAHTIISCPMGVIRRGGIPVLVDVDPETWTIDVAQVKRKINPKTRVIMPVHMFGHPCDMDALKDAIAGENIFILEDAAEAHGAEYFGRKCGSLGDIAAFSFYANKIVTTGEGGMVLTNDKNYADRARSYRNLCFQSQQRFLHNELGYNFRMTNLQAALGVAQVEMIDRHLERKIWQGREYTNRLKDIPGITLQGVKPWAKHVYWVFGILLNDDIPLDAFRLAQLLVEKGVQTRPFFWPLNEQPVFDKMGLFKGEEYPVSQKLARRGLYLPSGMALTETQLEEAASVLSYVLGTL